MSLVSGERAAATTAHLIRLVFSISDWTTAVCGPGAALDGSLKGGHSHRTHEGHGLPGRRQLNTQDRPIVAPGWASASWFWARIKALRACNGTSSDGDALAYQAISRSRA